MDTMAFNFTNCSDEAKSIFTSANDSGSSSSDGTVGTAPTLEVGHGAENIGSGMGQASRFSAMAAPFYSRLGATTPQEPRVGDTAPSTEELLMSLRISDTSTYAEDRREANPQYAYNMGSRSAEAAPPSMAPGTAWPNETRSRESEMRESFDFFVRTLSSANAYASMMTREQIAVMTSMRPSLFFEFLQEIVRIREQKRMQRALPNECAFCKNNGENEENYSSHMLKDNRGRVQCPVLRAFRCPRCGATGDRAHTIKYCPANDNNGFDRRRGSTFSLNEGPRANYVGPSSPPHQTLTASSYGNASSFWSNFNTN